MAQAWVALDEVSGVTDDELIPRLKQLVRDDQALQHRLLLHLGEVDARRLYREQAYASMFMYCVEELRMSEAEAYVRIQAARLSRKFPRILQLLAQGTLHLTAIKLLGPHLTASNHVDLLERACGKRKRELERLVAEIAPKPDVPNRVRKLPEPRSTRDTRPQAQLAPTSVDVTQASTVPSATQTLNALPEEASAAATQQSPVPVARPTLSTLPEGSAAATQRSRVPGARQSLNVLPEEASDPMRETPSQEVSTVTRSRNASVLSGDGARAANPTLFALEVPRQRGSSKPLSPGRYKVEFTAGQALHDKLAQLQDLLRHQVPDGELAVIVERAVDLLIDDTLKQRFAQTRAPARKKPCSAKRSAEACDPSGGTAVATEAPSASPSRGARRSRKSNSRYIPRAVVREVYRRDAGQCTFVSSGGKRCAERGFLELHHHDQPYARGGRATVDNLRLACRAHNALFADRDYGRAFMRSKQRPTREPNDGTRSGQSALTSSPNPRGVGATIDLGAMPRTP